MTKEEKIAKAIEAYESGMTITEVAAHIQTPQMTTFRWLQKSGIRMRALGEIRKGKPWSDARRAHHPEKQKRPDDAPRGYDILSQRSLGNRSTQKRGYVVVVTGRKEKQYEHILVAEKAIGRKLQKGEVVHHINCIRNDNRPENLLVCTISYHLKLHAAMRKNPYWTGVEAHAKSINYRNP